MTGAAALARMLEPEDIGYVFGIAGGKIAPFLKAISGNPRIRYIGVRHEASAAYMAAALFAATGQMAVAFSEIGPGTGNIVAGIASAYNNRLPLLLISSSNQHAANYPPAGMFMELDSAALLRPVTKWNAVVHDVRRIPELMRCAFREALTARPGPVHLDIPQDVLQKSCDFPEHEMGWRPAQYRVVTPLSPDPRLIAAAAHLLCHAQRPLLIAGGGVARARAEDGFRRLGHALHAPMTATQMGIGCAATTDPLFIGHGGLLAGEAALRAFREADVVLAAGCRFSSWLWDDHGPFLRMPQKLIHIDVDPAVIGRLVPVEIGIAACASVALPALAEAVRTLPVRQGAAGWMAGLAADHASYRRTLTALAEERGTVMHPAALAAEIGRCLPEDALVALDGGHTSFWSNDFTPVARPRTTFHEPGMAQLGFGLPYALALQARFPAARVFNVTGDGSFGFTLQELDSARREGLNVVTIIHNNAAWGVIAMGQNRAGFSLGTELAGTDYAAIARGFGCFGEVVTSLEALAPALAHALGSGLPAVLDCRTRFVPHPILPAFGRMGQVGMAT